MEDKKKLSDDLDELFTSLHDLVDGARDVVHSFLEVYAKPPSKGEFMSEAEKIWEEYFESYSK